MTLAALSRRQALAAMAGFAALGLPWRGADAAPRIERVVSPGGIAAWLVSDRRIPVVSMQMAFRGGAALDPAEKLGRANLATRLLDEGAGPYDSQEFQRRVEDISASLGFDDGRDTTGGWVKTLSRHRTEAFDLLRLAMTAPRFDAEPLERARSAVLGRLKRNGEDPDYLAGRLWWRRMAGDHPYARPGSGVPRTVEKISAEDVRAFAGERLARDNLVVGCVGDISAGELAGALDAVFGALPARAAPWRLPAAPLRALGGTVVLERPVSQSVASFGHVGIKRGDPDYYTAFVMNHILGGGSFSSRLYQEVRERRGLAYSIYTVLNPLDAGGFVQGGVATQNARMAETIAIVRDQWRRMAGEGASTAEIADAKSFLTGSFPLQFDSTDRIARLLVSIQLDDLGLDYLDRRNAFIEAVSGSDVARVARRLLDPAQLTFAVVGQPAGLEAERVDAIE